LRARFGNINPMDSRTSKKNFSDNSKVLKAFFLYAIASMFFFLLTTNGWSGLLYFIFGIPFYIGFFLILCIAAFFRSLRPSKMVLRITLGIQGLLLLLNFGDCGDAGYEGMNFIQRLAKGHLAGGSCLDIGVYSPIVPFGFIFFLLILYALCLFITFFSQNSLLFIRSLHPKKLIKTVVRIWKYGP
jgi:hypothetical protein